MGGSLDYLRHIVRTSLRPFSKFVRLLPLSRYRRKLPPEPYHVARLAATRDADCGSCVQIEANLARKDNLPADIIRAAAAGDVEKLPPELAGVYRFTEMVVKQTGDEGELREKLRQRYGEEAFIELAIAIGVCRVFPTVKRALGYAVSCAAVEVKV
jgi:alkylhydroperoxidase family enzyme